MGRVKVERPGGGGDFWEKLVPLYAYFVTSETAYNYSSMVLHCKNYIDAGYTEFYICGTCKNELGDDGAYRTWSRASWDGAKFTVELIEDFQGSGYPYVSAPAIGNILTMNFSYQNSGQGMAVFGLKA